MSTLKATTIEPATGTNVTLGTTGDTVALPGNTLALDTWKDSGGNTLFTSNGSGVVSSVNSGLAGAGPVLIQSQTASSSSGVAFTTGIDSTYDRYMFVFFNINVSTDTAYFTFQSSTDGGSSYGVTNTSTFFQAHHYYDWSTGTGLAYDASRDAAQSTSYILFTNHLDNGATTGTVGILNLYAPSSTTYVKQWTARTAQQYYLPTSALDVYTAGYFNTTSAIDAVNFKTDSGTFDGKIKLYGVK